MEWYGAACDLPDAKSDFAPQPLGDTGACHALLFEPGGIRPDLIWNGS